MGKENAGWWVDGTIDELDQNFCNLKMI